MIRIKYLTEIPSHYKLEFVPREVPLKKLTKERKQELEKYIKNLLVNKGQEFGDYKIVYTIHSTGMTVNLINFSDTEDYPIRNMEIEKDGVIHGVTCDYCDYRLACLFNEADGICAENVDVMKKINIKLMETFHFHYPREAVEKILEDEGFTRVRWGPDVELDSVFEKDEITIYING